MEPLAVDAALLRAALTPELNLSVGRELMVRVAAIEQPGRGQLSLAGMLLKAELPLEVKEGDELRLQVREMTPSRVVLAIQEQPQTPLTPVPVDVQRVPMPAGGSVEVTERDARQRGASDGTYTLSLRYDAPSLGAIDMTFTLGPTGLKLGLTVPRGAPHTVSQGAVPELADALTAASGRPVQITIVPRHEPLEVYA